MIRSFCGSLGVQVHDQLFLTVNAYLFRWFLLPVTVGLPRKEIKSKNTHHTVIRTLTRSQLNRMVAD